MPITYHKSVTVADLIADVADIYICCDWCKGGRRVRLQRILERKGPDTLMMDRLPLCTTPGCLGVRRLRDRAHTVKGWLLTPAGEGEYREHHDWLNRTRVLLRRNDLVVAKVMDLPKPD